MLRLYSMYTQYVRRRRIKQALEAAGVDSNVAGSNETLSILEFEMQQEQERKTKVGQKLEGGTWLSQGQGYQSLAW